MTVNTTTTPTIEYNVKLLVVAGSCRPCELFVQLSVRNIPAVALVMDSCLLVCVDEISNTVSVVASIPSLRSVFVVVVSWE